MQKFLILSLIVGLAAPGLANEYIDDPERLSELPSPKTPEYKYLKSRLLKCTGDGSKIEPAIEMELNGRKYDFDGENLTLEGKDPDGVVTVGILGAIKDFSGETKTALNFYLDRFAKEKVDVLVLNGDLAATEFEITQVLLHCAQKNWPVLALIGNTEGRTAFNRAVLASTKVAKNVINMDFVRKVDLGGATLVSLPGYIDRKFVHQSGGCTYKPRDVDKLSAYTSKANGPVVLISHGPPACKDKKGLDVAVEAGNVGDAHLAGFLREHKIPFGVFGHILEAGGRAVDGAGKTLKGKTFLKQFYLNVGSANPLPWQLNSGKLTCGMGAVIKIKGEQGSFEFIENPCKK